MITQENIPYTVDEIKSMVKTCEKYNRALERAKYALTTDMDNSGHWAVNYIFPELKEDNNEEKIRKSLISFLKSPFVHENITDEKVDPWIDWLEKQDANKEYVFRPVAGTTIETGVEQAMAQGDKTILAFNGAYIPVKGKTSDEILTEYEHWLERQGNVDKASYEIAEKEKYDFVSGQFIECRKSFNEFKEDNSYWFEYIGNDTYIGRSDNILNQKFHITPRQLYRLFTQQHCPKENDVNEETNVPTEYGKYVDECLNEAAKHFFSEGEDVYSVADLFYAGVRCGKSCPEKQGEKTNPYNGTSFEYNGHIWGMCARDNGVEILFDGELKAFISLEKSFIYPIYPKLAHKSPIESIKDNVDNNNKVKPKFHEGDWISGYYTNYKVLSVNNEGYLVEDIDGNKINILFENEKFHHFFTIADAKDGDVLVDSYSKDSIIILYKGIDKEQNILAYCGWNGYSFSINTNGFGYGGLENTNYLPATKEQRELLFSKMKQEGYEWDDENKKLSKQPLKITPKFCVGQVITDDNGTWYKITNIKCLDDWYYEVYDVGEDNTHHELCSIIDEKFRKMRFVNEIKKMLEY